MANWRPSKSEAMLSFSRSVIEPFRVPIGGREYSYLEYLALPPETRSNDEADVVDMRFAQATLEWLGFHKNEGHFRYNRSVTTRGNTMASILQELK